MQFRLSKYMIPSIISMVVVGTNTNIDGFFIGNALGDDGLAAINIVWPIVALIASLGTGLGVGGAVIFNQMRGENKQREAECVKNTTLLFLMAAGLAAGLLLYVCCRPLLRLMGAEGAVLAHAGDYAVVISAGAVFQVMGAGLLVLLRNDHKTVQSMAYSIAGLAVHLLLNAFLTQKYAMYGVAAATVVSQGVIVVCGLGSLHMEKAAKPDRRYVIPICKDASAPFGINFVPSLVLLFTNSFALKTGGVAAVSAYAVMSYAVYTFDYIFQGICDGIQPVVSYYHGARDGAGKAHAVKYAGGILAVFSVFCILLTPLLTVFMPRVFAVSADAERLMRRGFWIYALAYPFKAWVKFVCSYYYAAGQRKLSNMLVYVDPLVFTPGFLLLLTAAVGIDGVWLSMPFAQIAMAALAAATVLRNKEMVQG